MLIRVVIAALLLVIWSTPGVVAQDAAAVVAAASKAMGVDNLNSITYSGTRAKRRVRPEQEHWRADGRRST